VYIYIFEFVRLHYVHHVQSSTVWSRPSRGMKTIKRLKLRPRGDESPPIECWIPQGLAQITLCYVLASYESITHSFRILFCTFGSRAAPAVVGRNRFIAKFRWGQKRNLDTFSRELDRVDIVIVQLLLLCCVLAIAAFI
jgi:hypothetical protein